MSQERIIPINLWEVEANNINFNTSYVFYGSEIDRIKDFLSPKNESINFLWATKGGGKTILLKTKRNKLHDQNIFCIPRDEMVDSPTTLSNMSKTGSEIFKEFDKWVDIWKISLAISVFQHLKYYASAYYKAIFEIDDPLYNEIINNRACINPCEHFLRFLSVGKRGGITKDYLDDLLELCENKIWPLYKKIDDIKVAIFIDNIDENMRRFIERPERDPEWHESFNGDMAWYYSQLGLMKAVYDLKSSNKNIQIFASIRKQVSKKVKVFKDSLLAILSSKIDISYSDYELRQMFELYVANERFENLADQTVNRKDNPVRAFFGIDQLPHSIVVGESEGILENILRHTLGRPRDLIQICRDVLEDRQKGLIDFSNHQDYKISIKKSLPNIIDTYIAEHSLLFTPNLNRDDINILDKYILSNVLTREDVQRICYQYNCDFENIPKSRSICKGKCSTCSGNQPFWYLYNMGLLGTVEDNSSFGRGPIQKFLYPGENVYEQEHELPSSNIYLLHPCMQSIMNFSIHPSNIVGDGRKWDYNKYYNFATANKNGSKNAKLTPTELDAWNFLSNNNKVNLKEFSVVGEYYRHSEDNRYILTELYKNIISPLTTSPNQELENHLIWGSPGCGKSYFIEQIKDCHNIELIPINMASIKRTELINSLKRINNSKNPVLCFLDEIDLKGDTEWSFEDVLPYLDINKKSMNINVVFVLAGSAPEGIKSMISIIEKKDKGPDFMSRIPKKSKIPDITGADMIIAAVGNIMKESGRNKKTINAIEKEALFYMISKAERENGGLRKISYYATKALSNTTDDTIKYDDLFDRHIVGNEDKYQEKIYLAKYGFDMKSYLQIIN